MRLFYLTLAAVLLTGCTSSKYNCADIFNSRKEKLPWKYAVKKTNQRKRLTFNEGKSPDENLLPGLLESPMIASIGPEHITEPQKGGQRIIGEFHEDPAIQRRSTYKVATVTKDSPLKKQLKEHNICYDSTILVDQDSAFVKARKFGIISFVTSLGGLLSTVFTPYFLLPFLIVSLFTGVTSLKHYRKTSNKDSRGFAIAGLTISSVSVLLVLVAVIYLVVVFAMGNTFTP